MCAWKSRIEASVTAAPLRRCWLGRQDSNLRMPVPKTGALPLGDAPAGVPADAGKRGLYRRGGELEVSSDRIVARLAGDRHPPQFSECLDPRLAAEAAVA